MRWISKELVLSITLGLLAVTSVFFFQTSLGKVVLEDVRGGVWETIAPVTGGIAATQGWVEGFFQSIQTRGRLLEENRNLQGEIQRLTQENTVLMEEHQENIRLREMVDFAQKNPEMRLLTAQVVGRSPDNWNSRLVIDRGSNNGVKVNDPIVVSEGLVGRVSRVTPNTAEVLLLLDPQGAAGALIQSSRTPGVIRGTGGSYAARLEMYYIPYDIPLNPGEVVVTSGMGDIFPGGLRIGYLAGSQIEPGGLMQRAVVKPYVDFNRLEEVMVLLSWGA